MKLFTAELSIDTETPVSAYHKLCADRAYSFLFESAEVNGEGGRFSLVGFDPLTVLTFEQDATVNPLDVLRERVASLSPGCEGGGRFEAGFVGYFSYEVMRHFERVPVPEQAAACGIPEGVFFLPRAVLVFDHVRHTVALHGMVESEGAFHALRDTVLARLELPLPMPSFSLPRLSEGRDESAVLLSPSAEAFCSRVNRAKEAISSGEIFQVVLSHSMEMTTNRDTLTLYRRLRRSNPSSYMFLMNFDGFSVVGASPETLVRLEGGEVTVKPIAGTRPRGATSMEDARLACELEADPKERAEHMMLVDLGRNDVGRVCVGGSVRVRSLARVERFSSVMHLVSTVTGRVREELDMFDVFRACFPAGTLTGAPKIRACELISKWEERQRGLYGGAVGYFGLNDTMDFAIAIRTMVHKNGTAYVQAGAGVVYDSVPQKEHEECLHKAHSCLAVL